MNQDIPSFLSDKNDIISFDYNQIDTFLDSDINHYKFIPNLALILFLHSGRIISDATCIDFIFLNLKDLSYIKLAIKLANEG